jgi:DNA mismatch repair ATPase MutS
VERIAASAEILRCFAQTKTLCFAATHDLELTGLLEDVYDNYHFSEQIVDGDVCFSYKLKTGPSNSCNAIALLDSLGYDRTLVEKARQRADRFMSLGSWQQNDQNV